MDILPAHFAVLVAIEKYMVLSYQDYQEAAQKSDSEPTLSFLAAKHLGVACLMVAVLDRVLAVRPDTDIDRILYVLPYMLEIPYVVETDMDPIRQAFHEMNGFKIIRENASILDFVAERAWWAAYKNYDYSTDSALTGYVSGLLSGYDQWRRYELRCIEQ